MAHELMIMKNGKAAMAWAGQEPWHGLGTQVPGDLTPQQMLEAAGLDWEVRKGTLFGKVGSKQVNVTKTTNEVGLFRVFKDGEVDALDTVGKDWIPLQNAEAFELFHEYVMAGQAKMETAGAIRNGKIVWGMASLNEEFEAVRHDVVKMNLLFTVFHWYGRPNDVRFTPIRVVCNNTLSMAIGQNVAADKSMKIDHRTAYDPERVKETLGIARKEMHEYAEQAKFLGKKTVSKEDLVDYFDYVFPRTSDAKGKQQPSKQFTRAMELLEVQPGADLCQGTWWNAFNAVTFITNHEMGKDAVRLENVWYGGTRKRNLMALTKALEMASV
jgi:phage/plasmid-like protein (TIGR03299 family)